MHWDHPAPTSSPGLGRIAKRIARIATLALLSSTSAGCFETLVGGGILGGTIGALNSRDIGVRRGAAVKVRLPAPRDIELVSSNGRDTSRLQNIEYLIGRVRRIRGDTVWLYVTEAGPAPRRILYSRTLRPTARLTPDHNTRIEPIGSRAAYIVTGAVLGTTITAATIILIYILSGQ